MITLQQFDQACASMKGYTGVIGMFGGNPTMHPQFDELCEIMSHRIPFEQRGLWCNNLLGKGAIARKTFNPHVSNINVHNDKAAFAEFRRDWPEVPILGAHQDSRHSPVFVAMKDIIPDESERWELISKCDINQYWSALIGVFRGELRAWFCEIAGSQSMLHQNEPDYPDTGIPVQEGWWQRQMPDFAHQVRKHCHECSVPLKGHGALANSGPTEQVSQTHAAIFKTKVRDRPVELVTLRDQLGNPLERSTNYIGNAHK